MSQDKCLLTIKVSGIALAILTSPELALRRMLKPRSRTGPLSLAFSNSKVTYAKS